MDFGIASVAAIVAICYFIGLGVKASGINDKWITVIVAVTGGLLGIAGMYVMPDYPANDVINAVAIGMVSGASSTWIDQTKKQLSKKVTEQ